MNIIRSQKKKEETAKNVWINILVYMIKYYLNTLPRTWVAWCFFS